MLRIFGDGPRLCDGMTRREWLRIGGIGLGGLTVSGLQQALAGESAGSGKAKSVIVLFFSGGVPQHETWDPKPDAPEEIRGSFGAIASKTPGLAVGELMPQTACLTDKIAVIRTMVTGDNAHSSSGYQMLTGVPHAPLNKENALPGRPNDWPSMNAMVRALKPAQGGLPAAITLPRKLANVGDKTWPGQDGGFIGRKHDPWLLACDPAADDFAVPGCELPEELTPMRLDRRVSLLEQFNRHVDAIDDNAQVRGFGLQTEQALGLLAGGKARAAFNLDLEPDAVRDRYGRHGFGQSALLARRLVEAGVSLVQVNWPRIKGNKENNGSWDTHKAHCKSLEGWLMPTMDQGYSALIEDLADRGMLDETVVCWAGEFGHTPRINRNAGRDHWGRVFSIALAGGGIAGGTVYGATDGQAAQPLGDAVRPCDYMATVFRCLGFEPETMVHDVENRPIPITQGRAIEAILS